MSSARSMAIAATITLTSCSAQQLNPQWNGERADAPYPLTVGVISSAEFRKYERENWKIGEASDKLLNQVFARVFEHTVVFESREQFAKQAHELPGAIDLAIEYFSATVDRRKSYVAIRYRFTLYSPNGDQVTSWREVGAGITLNTPTFTFGPMLATPTGACELALEHAAIAIASDFGKTPEIRTWLVASGVSKDSISQPDPPDPRYVSCVVNGKQRELVPAYECDQ